MTPFYRDASVTLYCGDGFVITPDVLVEYGVDHVMTDPPYDAATHDGARTNATADKKLEIGFDPIDPTILGPWLGKWARRWTLAFCGLEMLGDYRRAVGDAWMRAGFWWRPDGTPQISGDRPAQPGEGIAIWHRSLTEGRNGHARWNGGGAQAMYRYGVVRGRERVHPTQKPEPLMAELIEQFTDVDETIFDPFAGSGTTLVAAKRLGRKAIGIELDEQWCREAVRRLGQERLPF